MVSLKCIYDLFHLTLLLTICSDKRVFLPRIVDVPTELHGKLYKSHKKDLAMVEIGSLEEIDKLIPHGPYQLREPDLGGTDGMFVIYLFSNAFVSNIL